MKIKDLPENINLGGVRFIHPETKKPVYWYSQWEKGIWIKEENDSRQFFPLFVNDLKEALEFEVADDSREVTK